MVLISFILAYLSLLNTIEFLRYYHKSFPNTFVFLGYPGSFILILISIRRGLEAVIKG